MKYLFFIMAIILCVAALATYLSFPDVRSEVPVVYWVTDRNPMRAGQVAGFHEWLVEQGYVTEDGKPAVELRLDTSNQDITKKVIQSVSGIGADLIDTRSGSNMRLFHAMGFITDVTDEGKRLGFGTDTTWEAIEPEIAIDGRQYMAPCNVGTNMLWINRATFEKYGQPLPPERWTFEEFERMGKAFVEAANKGTRAGERVFYVDNLDLRILYRSLGLSSFNETLTACDLDDERYARVLKLQRKWTYEDRLLPTPDDRQSFDAQQGYGGLSPQLFHRGNYAMISSGRYIVIQLRTFGQMDLDATEVPHGGFPNSSANTRAVSLYAGTGHPDLAVLFLAYLSSEPYNMQIVRDGDALPPNPVYTKTEEFLRPPQYPNEWGIHEKFARTMEQIAIGGAYSPFIFDSEFNREREWYLALFEQGSITAEQAATQTAEAVNRRIMENLRRDPSLMPEYERMVSLQRQIDDRLASGRKLPRAWVMNPFYQRYYEARGMLEEESPNAKAQAAAGMPRD